MSVPIKSSFRVRRVREIRTTEDHQMIMRMDDGEIVIVDFLKEIIPENTAFEVLKDPKVFQAAEAQGSGVRWEDEDIDIEVAELYDSSQPLDLDQLVNS